MCIFLNVCMFDYILYWAIIVPFFVVAFLFDISAFVMFGFTMVFSFLKCGLKLNLQEVLSMTP